jgi:hypothetical protein
MSTAEMEKRILSLRNEGKGILKIGRELGVGTALWCSGCPGAAAGSLDVLAGGRVDTARGRPGERAAADAGQLRADQAIEAE